MSVGSPESRTPSLSLSRNARTLLRPLSPASIVPSPLVSFHTLPLITPLSPLLPPLALTTTGVPALSSPLMPFLRIALPSSRHSPPLTQSRTRKLRFVEPVVPRSEVTVNFNVAVFQVMLAPLTVPPVFSEDDRA